MIQEKGLDQTRHKPRTESVKPQLRASHTEEAECLKRYNTYVKIGLSHITCSTFLSTVNNPGRPGPAKMI